MKDSFNRKFMRILKKKINNKRTQSIDNNFNFETDLKDIIQNKISFETKRKT